MSTESTVTFEFRLPDPGEGLTEATIEEWLVEEGDQIEEGQVLLEVETDKAIVEIPAPCPGTVVELRAAVGEVKDVGEVIALIETDQPPRQVVGEGTPATAERARQAEAESAAEAEAAAAESAAEPEPEPGPEAEAATAEPSPTTEAPADDGSTGGATADERVFAAPSTRRYAAERGVDLQDVEGSGPGGRITRGDVDAHLEARQAAAPAEPTPTAEPEPEGPAEGTFQETPEGPVVRKPFTGLRRTIADNMSRSWANVPRVTSGSSVPAKRFIELRENLNEKHDVNITYTALMVKAVVPALKAFPMVNAEIDEENDEIVEKKYYHIGVATNTEAGLLVPVIRNADQKSIVEIAEELGGIVEQARDRSIDLENLRGSTFTITNTGSHGGGDSGTRGTFGTPIVNHPEVAILGMSRIRNEVVPVNDEDMEVQKRLPLTFSYDHRLIDGITAGRFMGMVTSSIEDPDLLLARI